MVLHKLCTSGDKIIIKIYIIEIIIINQCYYSIYDPDSIYTYIIFFLQSNHSSRAWLVGRTKKINANALEYASRRDCALRTRTLEKIQPLSVCVLLLLLCICLCTTKMVRVWASSSSSYAFAILNCVICVWFALSHSTH